MKYLVGIHGKAEYPVAAVFPDDLTHAIVAMAFKAGGCSVRSAGFVHKGDDGLWRVSAEASESLDNLGPHPGDEAILRAFLEQGLTGLALSNYLAYQSIERQKEEAAKNSGTGYGPKLKPYWGEGDGGNEVQTGKRRGRPKGSKNRPKGEEGARRR